MRPQSSPWPALAGAIEGASLAHRGLWSPRAPENSLAAFSAAVAAGYGIELDVRLSADGEAYVFHDADVARMTGALGALEDLDASQIDSLRLQGTGEAPPRLEAVLDAVPAQAVVLVELKIPDGQEGPLERRVAHILERRPLNAAVIGFNPCAHAWFRTNRPDIPRGLNIQSAEDLQAVTPNGPALAVAAPDFLLPALGALPHTAVQAVRAAGAPLVAWTARSPADDLAARPLCDAVIFEGYRP